MNIHLNIETAPNGNMIVSVSPEDQLELQNLRNECPDTFSHENMRYELFEDLIANSEYSWVSPEEIGALTDAPILGTRGDTLDFGDVKFVWAFMDYETRTMQDELADKGRVRLTAGGN